MQMLNPQGLLGERLLSAQETAEVLDCPPKTLAAWRSTGRNGDRLPFLKIGCRIRYKESAVKAFLESCVRTHTD